ncbi:MULTISPECIES: lysylphosphatidylglycerol synthase transmembrane domain-containing protein [Coprobacillaceae]|uniref:lysylphosphatidylglycerol synthase transmembrane domain-containing protein n=1 Tax=Coprobacillaceae TaxID=2810280 RepID=UPI000E4FE806|nr:MULTISPECIES: lysylphosphatidylglycerol synthase transmembrane domain-containing protein [Coprobacillaceae]RHM59048.1 UPF0104 family protein [Coprobacillus sp. AF33-1AC]RHS91509.1 UPF0104 family protein [Erysipelatoclostridium sp. AM42-17]
MDKKSKKKYFLNILIILLVGGLSIYFSIGSQLQSTIHYLTHANYLWIVICIIVMFIYYLVNALGLVVFARVYKKDYTIKQGITNSLSGVFFSGITPMSTGGQFYQVYVFNKQGISATFSSSILLMLFIVYQSVLVVYTSIIMLFRYTYYSSIYSKFFSLAIIGFLINFAVISSLFLGAKSRRLQNFVCNNILKLLAKVHIVRNYEDKRIKIERQLSSFRDELTLLQKNREVLIKSILLNVLRLTLLYSMPFLTAKAMGTALNWSYFFDFIGITSFIYMISDFVPLPGASGGSEGTFYFLLHGFLKGGTSATLLVWRFITYYMGLIVGGITVMISKEIHTTKSKIATSNDEVIVEEIDEIQLQDIKK